MEAIKGEPLILTMKAEGEQPMTYKWYKGAQELKYCTGNSLRIESANIMDNGQYCCTVSNAYGSVLSDVVLVKIVLQKSPLPSITTHSELIYVQSHPTVSLPLSVFTLHLLPLYPW